MRQGGVDVVEVFDQTRVTVNQLTQGALLPWSASKLTEPYYIFERAADAPPPAVATAVTNQPIAGLPADAAYAAALQRDTIRGYEEYLAHYPNSTQAPRVRAILAALREAYFWRRSVNANTAHAYWTYLRRYPKGPHVADARRRLAMISAAYEPPPDFQPMTIRTCRRRRQTKTFTRRSPYYAFDAFGPPPLPPPPEYYHNITTSKMMSGAICRRPRRRLTLAFCRCCQSEFRSWPARSRSNNTTHYNRNGVAPAGLPPFRPPPPPPPPLPRNITPVQPPPPIPVRVTGPASGHVKPLPPIGPPAGQAAAATPAAPAVGQTARRSAGAPAAGKLPTGAPVAPALGGKLPTAPPGAPAPLPGAPGDAGRKAAGRRDRSPGRKAADGRRAWRRSSADRSPAAPLGGKTPGAATSPAAGKPPAGTLIAPAPGKALPVAPPPVVTAPNTTPKPLPKPPGQAPAPTQECGSETGRQSAFRSPSGSADRAAASGRSRAVATADRPSPRVRAPPPPVVHRATGAGRPAPPPARRLSMRHVRRRRSFMRRLRSFMRPRPAGGPCTASAVGRPCAAADTGGSRPAATGPACATVRKAWTTAVPQVDRTKGALRPGRNHA